ncbi:hypothetical protein [Paenibacillus mucilaginosus]|nr:hypothetical protein [Paenibacillus mucilaginosus]AFH64168.1 hypothetical protein B2K_26350 [Paenibacillus mucilaginosus K02]AEI44270.1 hypothetical protein KNP414_05746 [Paenibacillus mucilaginosus KNP414]MCG7216678.1 hypothetical protein [Paenibacillus mucilaginosus]WDM25670.1 hypothetical protein KCX80_24920 [Paenibacillus mucilaginosus]WFA20324.1 hypothetical protein ERY13_25380 [Paenibacillus mucilaginosus]
MNETMQDMKQHRTGIRSWSRVLQKAVIGVSMLGVLALAPGCGKSIPVIEPALLEKKASLLVVTGPALAEADKASLQTALTQWQNTKHLSYEWVQNADSSATWTPDLIAKTGSRNYDYIVVAGHDLARSALTAAQQVTQRKWLLLDDGLTRDTVQVSGDHIQMKMVQDAEFRALWDPWVKEQTKAGRTIEWVTTSAYPVPGEWAPSEEAEYISLSDAEGWYGQFQHQVRRHGPDWIAVYAPMDSAAVQRMRSLQIPVMNMGGTTVQLQWNGILTLLQGAIDGQAWTPGIQPYTESEARIVKN